MFDVAIIGAGVVGGMIARKLTACDMKVCILEKESDVAEGATKANSAIIHAGFDAKAGTLKALLNKRGSDMMQDVCKELGVSYNRNGSMVLGFSNDDEKKLREIMENGEKNGINGLEIISRERIVELEPNIADGVTCALYAPTGAIVCPYELTLATIGNAMDNGAELMLDFKVERIEKTDVGFEILSDEGTMVDAKIVVNAAGLYSDEIADLAQCKSFSVHPRKGEYILLDKEAGMTVSHTLFTVPTSMGKGILVSPTVDGNLILGPTAVDMTDKENKDTERDGLDRIIAESARMVKSADIRQSITSFCGLRAVGDSGDFIIDMPSKGFVNVAGIESPGLSSAPAIAEYVAELLENNGFTLGVKVDFKGEREPMKGFSELSYEEKNEIIKKDPAYGRVVCRCENITEGEILRAIRTNPKPRDLDGVKRRTRAQMGRCQGGFCSPYITELLSKELGIPMEQVEKTGKDSYILSGRTKEVVENA